MGDASRLVRAMQRASKPKENDIVDIIMGTVTSVSPLKIKTDKLELTESFLILGALCKETKVKVPNGTVAIPAHTTNSAGGESGEHSHGVGQINTVSITPDITLWRGLQVGDNVYMLRCCQGQKYYVMQRKEGVV